MHRTRKKRTIERGGRACEEDDETAQEEDYLTKKYGSQKIEYTRKYKRTHRIKEEKDRDGIEEFIRGRKAEEKI